MYTKIHSNNLNEEGQLVVHLDRLPEPVAPTQAASVAIVECAASSASPSAAEIRPPSRVTRSRAAKAGGSKGPTQGQSFPEVASESSRAPSEDSCAPSETSRAPSVAAKSGNLKGAQGQPGLLEVASVSSRAPSATSNAPSVATLYSGVDEMSQSDNESVMFLSDTGSMETEGDSHTRKRAFLKEGPERSPDAVKGKKKGAKAKKTVVSDTHDVGLADAQRQLDLVRRAQVAQDLEEQVAAKEQRTRAARAKSGYGASHVLYADHSLTELERMAQEDEKEIVELASKSSNLKGTFQKSLKCRAASLRGIVGELVQRKATDETRQLQAKVDRLQWEVSQLHQKLAEVTTRPSHVEPRPIAESQPSNFEDIIRKVVMEERAFMRACLAGIEDRLLPEKRFRPQPAAGKRLSEPGHSSNGEDALLPATTPSNHQGWTKVVKKKKGKAKTKTAAVSPADPAVPTTAPPNPKEKGHQGNIKGKGKGKGKKAKPATAAPTAVRAPAGAGRKLIPPKSAAVVVTLTVEATERGETYASIMKRARTNADPTQLGIGKITCRRTQAGARIFEFPGSQGTANANLFATKLQEVIADSAMVARPEKSVALELTGLDDSVSKEDVVAAIAAVGGCDVAAVQGRAIRQGRDGMGSIRLRCPVAAAKVVLAKGRLPVGFSSGVIRALVNEPLRCYKCFGIGHLRVRCPSKVDRTDSCYRCGKEGHKSASCKAATPQCAVCAANGRPAGHVMKGRNCNPPPKKGKAQAPTRTATAISVSDAGASAAIEEGARTD